MMRYGLTDGDDDFENNEEWTDFDDDNFDDAAGDMDDLHKIKQDNNILSPDDDDHLPEDDLE